MKDQEILDYLKGPITSKQKEAMDTWILESEENAKQFYKIRALYIASNLHKAPNTVDTEKGLAEFKAKAYGRSAAYRHLVPYLRYAAVLVFLLGLGYLYQQGYFEASDTNLLIPAEESITLELENGEIKVITKDGELQVVNKEGNVVGAQQGSQLIYGSQNAEELVYNTLTVPYGRRFNIQLSDGTKVNLNSGSSITYPVTFLKGKQREVFLTGEAFFDVAKDTEHPFIVNAEELNVQVLGTQFNVSAYPEDKTTEVVLVEGSVKLYEQQLSPENEKSLLLQPGFRGTFERSNSKLSSRKANTRVYTAWRNGELVFRNLPFDLIRLKMERHYNVTIINTNQKLGKEEFNASFRDEPIQEILRYFNETHKIQYRIENNKVIIY